MRVKETKLSCHSSAMLRQFVFSAWVRTVTGMVVEVGEEGERAIFAAVERQFVTTERQFTTVPMTCSCFLPGEWISRERDSERECV